MKTIDTSSWAKDAQGWSIAPAGLAWIKKGTRVKIGEWVTIGEGAKIGEWVEIGARGAIGARVKIGAGAKIGARVAIGEGVQISEWVTIGDGTTIGAGAKDVTDLGHADGYRKVVAQIKGVAYIGTSCSWFTLAQALEHWGNHKEDRRMTMCLLQAAKAIADMNGWAYEAKTVN